MSNPFAKYLEASIRQEKLMEGKTNPRINTTLDESIPKLDESMFGKNTFKSTADIIGDTAVDATKAAMTLAQTGISALDLGAYSLGGLASAVQQVGHEIAPNAIPQPKVPEYGQITKVLDDGLGFNIGKAKQTLGELGYSDVRKAQEQELHTGYTQEQIDAFNNEWANQYNLQYQDLANKGANALQLEGFKAKFNDNYKKAYTDFIGKNQTSWDKSLGENLDAIGTAFNKVLDNPSLGVGAAIESTGYLAPSLLVSRGVAALQGAAKASAASRAVAAGTGEGLVSALALNEQMRGNSETGTIDGTKVAAGFGGGALTGLIGGVSNKLGSRFGLDDIDSLSLGTQAKGFSVTRPVLATAQEGGEEFLQSFGESIIPNIAEGNDPLQGLAQEVALGTVAGNIMGGATNAGSLVSGAGSDLVAGFNKVAEAVGKGKDAVTAKTFEEFNDPTNKAYDPAKAFNSQVPDLSSTDELVRAKAQENMDSVFEALEKRMTDLRTEARKYEVTLENYNALSEEDRKLPNLVKEKQDAEKELAQLKETIVKTDNQYGDLYLQKIALEKNQEVQAGIPQYSEVQAKADIELLSQEPVSSTVWTTEDNDGNTLNIPVTITGTPVVSNGYETVEVKYTDSTGKERTTYAPTSELVQDTTTQQEAAQRITKHFSKLSLDELATVAKSPYLSEEQRNSLRYLSEAKRAIASLASPSDVTNHIMNGLNGKTPMESHRGLNTYTDMVNAAINTKDEKLLNLALNDLGRFAQDHTDKANALVEANQLVTSGQFPKVQVLRSNDGTWGIVTDPNKFVDNIKLKATAGWNVTVHSNKKGAIDLVTKEATLIQDNLKALTQVGLSFGLQAVEPTVTPPVTVEALPENAKLQDANIKPTEDAEVLQEVDVVLPLVQQPVNLFEREDGTWSDDLLKARKEIRELHEEELKKWGEVNKPIPKGSFIDSLHTAFNPLSANTQIGLESTKSVDAALGLNVSLNALWALRLIFAKAYNSLQKTHAKRLKEKSGDYFSFRSKDDPKYKAHQEKLDALRQSVENAISTLKISLNALDKAILEKTKGTSEALQEANKPVATSSDTTDITSAITRLNKYNKSGTPLTIDSVTPEALQTLQAKVSSAFEIGAVNQQTYDGVTKDIATLQQYLSSAKPNKQNQEVSTKTTEALYDKLPSKTISGNVVKESWANLKNATKAISDKGVISTRIYNSTDKHFGNPFSSDEKVLANNPSLIKTNSTKESVEKYIDWVINSQDTRAKWVREQLKSGNLKGKPILYYTELNEPSHANALDYLINQYDWGNQQTTATTTDAPQTEPTAAVSNEPSKDTTQAVKVSKKDGVSGLKSISASKKNQTSDDVPDLVEALKAEAQKRVNLTDEDTVGYKALSELISLAYGNEISIKNLETIDQLFGEDLVNEALRIKSLPLGKRAEAQGYLEDIRFDIGSLGTFKARIEDVTPEDLNTYKELVFKLLKERNLSTKNASKIFNKLATYVNSNQAVEAPVTQDTSPVVDTVNTVLQNQKVTQTSNNTKPISNQTSEDTETLIEALESEASKRITLSEEDTIESEALNELISLAYGADVTNADLKTIREIFGEDLVNEALRIRNLPLSKKDEAQKYLEQIRTILASAVEVKFYVEEVTLEDLATYKEAVLGLLQKRKQNTANASKIFDVLTAYVTQNQAATAQPETKVESDEATQSEQSVENQPEIGEVELSNSADAISNLDETYQEPGQVEDGTITVLQDVTEEVRQEERSKLMSLRNMLVAYFTQSSVKEEGKGANPLVAVKDYILQSNLLTQVSNWLSTGYKVSNAQRKQLEHFKEFHQEFRKHILFSLQNSKRNRSDNNSDNFITYLITEDVKSLKDTLDENTLTAISLAAYSYLLQYGTKVTNTDDEIRKLLRLEKDALIPNVTSDLVRNAGQDAYSVAKELGSGISSSLGLKALKDSSTSMQDRLNTAFGLLAIAALHNSDYMYISRLPSGSIKAIKEDLGISTDSNDSFETQKGETLNLSQLTTISANYKLNPQTNKVAYKDGKAILVRGKDLEELLAVNKNTKGFLSQLFGVSVGFRLPSTSTPEKFTQKSIPNTNASIPSNQRKQVEAAQKNSNVMRVNTVNVFKTLFGLSEDSKYLKELLGIWVDDNVLAQTHVTKHESLKAKAENEWRLVNQGLEWAGYIELGNNEYAEFYDTQSVVQNNRMHIDSNLFNQQSSQIHRAMAAKSAFAVTFNIFENQELLTRFYQGVAEGLEKIEESIKQDILARNPRYNFFTVDKVPAEDFVPAFEKFLTTPKSIAAIDAIIALIQTKTISTEQQADIAWFVKQGGMGVQSLQSLIFLGELGIAAQADGVLTTTVSYGSDGINNGVSNANMLLGTAREGMRTQTGIISKNSTANNIQDVYAQGINDYYVDFGSYMRDFLDLIIDKAFEKISEIGDKGKRTNKTNKVNALLDLFTTFQVEVEDALGMRKIAKVWSIPFNYAAGKVALQRALANGFMKGIYDEMERINNSIIGKPRNSLEYATAIQDRNTLEARLNAVLTDYTFVNNKLIAFKPIKLPLPENLNTFTFQDSVIQNVGTKNDKGDMIFRDITLTGTDATYAIELALKTAMIQLHGKAAWKATEAFSKDYMNMYSLYLKAQGTSFELYNFIHSKLVQLKLDAKIKKSKVEGEYMGLTTLELQEIDNIIGNFKPVVNTPISSKATNATQSGIPLADKDKKLEKATPNRVVSSRYPIKGFEGNEKPNMKPALVSNQLTDKGTAGMALLIQGMDSLVASAVQAKYPILNIHDQASMPINLANEIIQYQNEVHLEGLITYHLGLENAKTLVNTFRGVLAFINSDSKVLEDEKANAELLASLATEFKEKLQPKLAEGEVVQNVKTGEESYSYKGLSLKYPDMALGESTTDLRDAIKTFVITAISNDIKKLNALLETKAIHQYGGEGGALPLTKKHREHIKEQLEYLQRQRVALVEAINSPITKDFTVVAEYQSPLITALESNKGKPITKTDVLDLLTKTTHHKDTDVLNQEQEVLKAIKDLIPDDLTLVYEEDTYEGQGYYNTETKRIHIKAITSEGSYVDTHLLVHELLHSAVAARLQAIKDNPNKYDEARAAVTQLEAIRQEVLNLLSTDGLIFTELNEKLNADNVDLTALSAEVIARLQAINKEEESLRKQQKELSAQWESSNAKEKSTIRRQQAELKQSIDSLTTERALKLQILKDIDAYKKARNSLRSIEVGGFGSALSLAYKLKNLDEFISYGLSNQALQAYLKGVQLNQNKRSAPERKSKWRRFVEAVTKLVSFRGNNGSNALTAFAVTTAELFESLKGVTPANTNQTLKSEHGASDQVNQMSSIEVMQSLPHTGNTDFGLHLNRLAETVIGQLYNNDEVAKAQIDVIQAIQVAPAIKAGFNLSQREAAVQRSLELVLETYTLNTTGGANASQLWKIYKEAQKNIKVENLYDGDWSTATAQERAATHQKFKYLFADNLKGTEALARFVSMALASEEVHSLLGFNTVTAKPSKQKSWFDTVSAWAQYVFAWLGNKLVRTSANDPAYKQLQSLVNNLVALDIRNRQDTVALYEKAWNLVGKVTEPLDKAAQSLRQYATNRDFLRNSKYLPLRTLGSIAALDAKAMGETIPKLIREMRDKARPNEKLGEAMNALMESTAMTQVRKAMEALIRQANLNAKERQDRTDNVKKAIMSWFKDGGKHITKEMHKAITYTLLRTDAQSLLTTFGLNKTIGLLLDTNKLKNEIDLVTKDVSQYPNGNSMINQSMRLAYYMVTNKGGLGLSKNPTAIAMGLGTNYQIKLEDVDQALVGKLDVLISLYAMKYTSAKDRKILGDMYAENPEALEGLLQMHKGFMTDAATEFKDNPLNYVKGWMPEIVNPYREVKVVNANKKEQMLKEGWKLIDEIKPQGSFLMIHPDIGYQRLVSGAVDLQNSHRKGTEIVNRTSRNYLDTVRANLAYTAHIASIPHTQFDPSKQETGLIPAYDTDGVPMGFNYEMASWVRDKEMERNNNFADLMGAYAGAMFYKPAKRNQSVTVANVLFEDYKQNYQKNPNSYIKLSGKSSDPKIVEMWRMLPKDFRQRATELYGKGEPIIINNEAFLLAFGFKKWTITSIWDKPADQRTDMETMFITMADNILKGTAKAKIAKAGHIWTEAVSKAKDFIVIRSISVLWHNVLSNGLMLMAYGINPITIAKEWTFATANVRAYQTLNSELIQLKANTLAGKGNDALERQINAIQKQLEANPMNKYINEGLLSSIVEDVTIQQGDYSYDSELKKKIDGVTGWLPDSVKTIGAWAVLNPSTQGYQFLATTTQLSDFVAKVTLAKHLESKGMDFKAAVSEASQTFINYDVPQGVGMQYMNDIGLFMFTKFFLRIQAVLLKLMDKKAATVLAQHIAVESLTDMQGILDPMALTRVGNWPFEEGAFSIVGASMSIAPVNVVF